MSDELIDNEIARLHQYSSEQRNVISDLLDEGYSHVISLFHELVQKFEEESLLGEGRSSLQQNVKMADQNELADIHTRMDSVLSEVSLYSLTIFLFLICYEYGSYSFDIKSFNG